MHAVVHHYEEGPQGVVVRYDDALEEKISQIEVILRAKYGEMETIHKEFPIADGRIAFYYDMECNNARTEMSGRFILFFK